MIKKLENKLRRMIRNEIKSMINEGNRITLAPWVDADDIKTIDVLLSKYTLNVDYKYYTGRGDSSPNSIEFLNNKIPPSIIKGISDEYEDEDGVEY